MKVVLEPKQLRNGYINVSQSFREVQNLAEHTVCVPGIFSQLDNVFQHQTVSEMIFDAPLNVIKFQDVKQLLAHWKNKLTKDGKLFVHFVDFFDFIEKSRYQKLTLENMNSMLLGPNLQYQSLLTLEFITAILKDVKMSIKIVSIENNITALEITNDN